MKAGGGSEKGAEFERWIAKQLNKWARLNSDDEDLFWRTPGSGSRQRTMKKAGTHAGDITCTGDRGKPFIDYFWCECKHYKSVDWRNFFFEEKGVMLTYWRRLEVDCLGANKAPFMVVRTNGHAPVVLTNSHGATVLGNRYIKITRLAPSALLVFVYPFNKFLEQPYEMFLQELEYLKDPTHRRVLV